jgi:hypothetical protein
MIARSMHVVIAGVIALLCAPASALAQRAGELSGSADRRGELGLITAEERIAAIGGALEIRTRPGAGTSW